MPKKLNPWPAVESVVLIALFQMLIENGTLNRDEVLERLDRLSTDLRKEPYGVGAAGMVEMVRTQLGGKRSPKPN